MILFKTNEMPFEGFAVLAALALRNLEDAELR